MTDKSDGRLIAQLLSGVRPSGCYGPVQGRGSDMKNTDIYAFSNFEFLVITFAQMARQGRAVNMDTVTGNMDTVSGNMDDRQREWFLE